MNDLLLPSTDAGVTAQLAIITAVFFAATWLVRSRPEMRLLVIGLWVSTYALAGLRALH